MAGKTTPSTGKSKPEGSKSESKIPRTYRKSPARVDASGDAKPRPKSPSRGTTGKSPIKPKSPARTKSPSRKSPAREKQEVKSPKGSPGRGRPRKNSEDIPLKTLKSAKASSTPVSKPKPIPVLTVDSDSDSDYTHGASSSEKPKARVQGRTRTRATDITSKLIDVTPTLSQNVPRTTREDSAMRRSTRLFNTNSERPVHLKSHYEPVVKLSEFSDEDDLVQKKVDTSPSPHKASFGAVIGNVIFAVLFPAVMVSLNAICTETSCKFQLPPLTPLLKPSTYYHPMSFVATLGYMLLITVLTVLPIGGRAVRGLPGLGGKQLTYCTNGLFVTAVMVGMVALAQW